MLPNPQVVADSGPAGRIPDLAQADVRANLTPAALEAMINIAKFWRLNGKQVSALLSGISEQDWFLIRDHHSRSVLSQDMLTRISALVGVYKGLHLLFSEPLANDWVQRQNADALFSGLSPLDFMTRRGLPGIVETRGYVDALRGGL